MRGRRRTVGAVVGAMGLASLAAPIIGWAQGRFGGQPEPIVQNVPYDGRYTFARIKYTMTTEDGGFGGFRRDIKWGHDWPRSDRHFPRILSEISSIRTRTEASEIFTLDEPELMKFPVAYLCEPGFWKPSDAEVEGMRNYLLKGGFMIIDDFAGSHWENFHTQIKKVFPELEPMRLTPEDRIFDAFYHITSLDYRHPYFGVPSEFWGLYENNDRNARLLAIINYNNDVSEYWEFSDEEMFPVNQTNDAYKLGINYLVYALTR